MIQDPQNSEPITGYVVHILNLQIYLYVYIWSSFMLNYIVNLLKLTEFFEEFGDAQIGLLDKKFKWAQIKIKLLQC